MTHRRVRDVGASSQSVDGEDGDRGVEDEDEDGFTRAELGVIIDQLYLLVLFLPRSAQVRV
jgi:hypothetical protein